MSNVPPDSIAPRLSASAKRRLLLNVLIYVSVAGAWIAGSDILLHQVDLPPAVANAIGTAKGIGFVLVTALTLYLLALRTLRREDRTIRRLSQVLGSSVDGIWFVDRHGMTTWANEVMGRILGIEAADMLGRPYSDFVPLKHVTLINARLLGTAAATGDVAEMTLLHADGRPVRVIASAQPLLSEQGEVDGAFCIITDITDTVRVRRELSLREQAIEHLPVAFCLVDATLPDQPLVYVNDSFVQLTGYPAAECLGRNCRFLQNADRAQPGAAAIARAVAQQVPGHAVLRNYHKDGSPFLNELTVVPLRGEDGTVSHFAGIQRDVTERMRTAERLERLAFTDSLTNLPNRARFEATLVGALARHGWSVVIIDIERLRDVNSTRGRRVGDRILNKIAQRLGADLGDGELLARLGGDQFALLRWGNGDVISASAALDEVMAALSAPYHVADDRLVLNFTAGLAIIGVDTTGPVDALQKAEVALYAAKFDRSRRSRVYDQVLGRRILDGIGMTEQLRAALDGDQFELFYQPKVSLIDGHLVGAEALIRWRHPVRGLELPGGFIPAAEQSGLIVPIGAWVLRAAASQIRSWREAGLTPPRIAVNVSRLQFDRGNLQDDLAQAIAAHALGPGSLALELTESVLMDVSAEFITRLVALRDLGCTLAIDDFGTGFSPLSYLHRFPLAELKIDRAFIDGLPLDQHARSIVGVIIGLGHALSLSVTAEGVENAEQAEYLAALGCDAAQGYYFSWPIPADRFAELLRRGESLP